MNDELDGSCHDGAYSRFAEIQSLPSELYSRRRTSFDDKNKSKARLWGPEDLLAVRNSSTNCVESGKSNCFVGERYTLPGENVQHAEEFDLKNVLVVVCHNHFEQEEGVC